MPLFVMLTWVPLFVMLTWPRSFRGNSVPTDWFLPFLDPRNQVLAYLGRYTHRAAISNPRPVGLSDGQVAFRWKDTATMPGRSTRHRRRPRPLGWLRP